MRLPLLLLTAVALAAGVGVTWAAAQLTASSEPAAEIVAVPDAAAVSASAAAAGPVTVHRDANCGCCGEHVAHLEQAGFTIEEVVHDDAAEVAALKDAHGIPAGMRSCHTSIVEGYAVEGHVPADVIAALLTERPEVDGIALPGMPTGSPGMPGEQSETWIFEAFADGAAQEAFTQR